MSCAFYTVADSRFFPGAVALVNSLRLVGHEEPITVLDCGLTPAQRDLLGAHVNVVPAPDGRHPAFLKWYAPLIAPADVMVHVDADVIVVRSLDPLLELAEEGRIAVFLDLFGNRFFPEWQTELGLGPLRRRPYFGAGLVALPRDPGVSLMQRMLTLSERIELRQTMWGYEGGGRGKPWPFIYGDQDIMNPLFAAELSDEQIVILDRALSPDLRNVRVRRRSTLECRTTDGRSPYVLHHAGLRKPWSERVPVNPYTLLLPRVLFGDDVAVRLDPRDFERRLRPGAVPDMLRWMHFYWWLSRLRTEKVVRRSASLARAGLRNPQDVYPFIVKRIRHARHKAES